MEKDLRDAFYMGVGYYLGKDSLLAGLFMFAGYFAFATLWNCVGNYIKSKFNKS